MLSRMEQATAILTILKMEYLKYPKPVSTFLIFTKHKSDSSRHDVGVLPEFPEINRDEL